MYTQLLFAVTALTAVSAQGISRSGRCGDAFGGLTCLGSSFGSCCSQYNYCGSTSGHCGAGCQAGFGTCTVSLPGLKVSPNGRCGGNTGYTCQGSSYGDCCSQNGWCGRSNAHCGIGCNPLAGICNTAASSTLIRSTSTTATATRSSAIAPSSSVKVSTNARCGNIQGATGGFNCQGSEWGNCCSKWGYCGSTSAYCGTGCQANFGSCNPAPVVSSSASSTATRSSSAVASSSLSSIAISSSAVSSSAISSSASSSTASSSAVASSSSSSSGVSTSASSSVASSTAGSSVVSSSASSSVASSSASSSADISSTASSSAVAPSSSSSGAASSSTDSSSAPATSTTPQVSTTPSPTPSPSSSASPTPSCFSAPAQYVPNYSFENGKVGPFAISAGSTGWSQSSYTYQPHTGSYVVKVSAIAGASQVLELQTTISIPSGTTVTGSGWAFPDTAPNPPIAFELLLDGVSFGNGFAPASDYYWGSFGGNNLVVVGDTHVLTIRITILSGSTPRGDHAQLDDISLTAVAPPVGVPMCT